MEQEAVKKRVRLAVYVVVWKTSMPKYLILLQQILNFSIYVWEWSKSLPWVISAPLFGQLHELMILLQALNNGFMKWAIFYNIKPVVWTTLV